MEKLKFFPASLVISFILCFLIVFLMANLGAVVLHVSDSPAMVTTALILALIGFCVVNGVYVRMERRIIDAAAEEKKKEQNLSADKKILADICVLICIVLMIGSICYGVFRFMNEPQPEPEEDRRSYLRV